MSQLSTFLGAGVTEFSDEDLVLLTILGRTFGRVVNPQVGEIPEDNLLAFLRAAAQAEDADAAKPFLDLVARLVDGASAGEAAHALSRKVLAELEPDERIDVATRVVRLLDLSGAPVPAAHLNALAERFSPGPQLRGAPLGVYWELVLSRFGSGAIPDRAIPVCRSMVLNENFIRGALVTTASARPHLFFNTIVPIVFEALRTPEDGEEEDWEKAELAASLARACRAGFRSLYRDPHRSARRRDDIRLLSNQIEVLVSAGDFSEVADAVVQAAVEATNTFIPAAESGRRGHGMPFPDLAMLESGLSRGRAQHRGAKPRSDDALKNVLSGHVEAIKEAIRKSGANEIDPILATNLIPYSEGVFFLIWRELLQRVELTMDLKPIAWNQVLNHFSDGNLSFAVWNEYVPNSLRKNTPTRLYITEKPLLTFSHYPFVMRRDRLEGVLERLPAASRGRKIIIKALARDRMTLDTDIASCRELVDAIAALPIGVVADTEFLEVGRRALGPRFSGNPSSSDDAVGNLVDGGLAGAFLGAVQADYLRRRFGDVTVRLTEVVHPTEVHLWFMRKNFGKRGYPKIVQPLLVAWEHVRQIWERATSSSTKPADRKLLQAWIEGLAMNLNAGVDGVGADMRTPITSWMELKRLMGHHDVLHEPAGVREIVDRPTSQHNVPGMKQTSIKTVSKKQQGAGSPKPVLVVNND